MKGTIEFQNSFILFDSLSLASVRKRVQFHSLRNSVLHASHGGKGDGVLSVYLLEFKVTLIS